MVRIVAGCNTAPAEHGGKTDGKVWYVPLTCLAPDIVKAILDGRQPKGLGLAEVLGSGSMGWKEQGANWPSAMLSQERTRWKSGRAAAG